jgi:hypothetical protein
MTVLTSNERAFIVKMKDSEELARHGFSLLLKRPDFLRFFEPLRDAGLFAPERNPAPEPAPEEGYVRIPYWSALDYLVETAKQAGIRNDLALADQVMEVVRAVSQWREANGQPRQNYQTARRFTEILGYVPTSAVTKSDLDLLATWLNDPFERMLVAVAIDETLLPHLLASSSAGDWDKAVTVLQHATAITWVEEPATKSKTARTVLDDHWLQRILVHHVQSLAAKQPRETIQLLERRVRDVYATELHKEHSTIYRPAVEDNNQNHRFSAAENRTVEALRDALLTWVGTDPKSAEPYHRALLRSDSEILRRIAIHILNQHWSTLHSLYLPFAQCESFTSGHLHELYALLTERFADFTEPERDATIDAIRRIPRPKHAEDLEIARKQLQRRWLTAIVGKGAAQADDWMDQLSADPSVGPSPQHPDFTSYMTSWSGPGASPYSVEELVGFADAHVLTERLNNFEETGTWGSPTLDGLSGTLQNAARTSPVTFLRALPDLEGSKNAFQQAIITGLQQAWDAKQQSAPCNWEEGWKQLIRFFETIIGKPTTAADENNQRKWLFATIADCLRAGTQADEHAYALDLLPPTLAIIDVMLQRLPGETRLTDDPMFTAINTPKGRVIEALFSHALRACRVADETTGSHTSAWVELQPIFDREIEACKNNNAEFSTLCGAYLAQLEYLDAGWSTRRMENIFPVESPINDQAAIAGLAYAAFTSHIYEHLLRNGVVDRALQYDLKEREVRKKLLERIAAAYVWGVETLESPRFQAIFSKGDAKELEHITWTLWTLRQQNVTDDQREHILQFWDRCIIWAHGQVSLPVGLLSALSGLAAYVTVLHTRERRLLLAVAPHVGIDFRVYEFLSELLRLTEQDELVIVEVVDAMIKAHAPEYDYEDRLQKLLRTLAKKGRKNDVLRILDRLPTMHNLYNELTETQPLAPGSD